MSINDNVRAMAEQIKAAMTTDTASGIVTTDDSIYEQTLPEEIPLATAHAVHKHDAEFVAASTFAFGQLAIDALKCNDNLASVTGTVKLENGSVDLTTHRRREFENRMAKDDQPKTVVKHGQTVATVHTSLGTNTGQNAQVRKEIVALATAALKK